VADVAAFVALVLAADALAAAFVSDVEAFDADVLALLA
jgi:hypothetical protein